MSQITEPIRLLLRQDIEFQWNYEQETAFNQIKVILTSNPVLKYFDVSKPVTVQCDASKSGLEKIVGSNIFQRSSLKSLSIIKRLAITLMYCNRLHAWWSTQSRLATLLSSLIARQWVGLQTLWRFRLKDLSFGEMVGAWCFGCCQTHRGLHVGFLLFRYSVLFTVEPLSLLYLLFILLSWFICSRR